MNKNSFFAAAAALAFCAIFVSCESNNVVKMENLAPGSAANQSTGKKVMNYFFGTGRFIEVDEASVYTTTPFGSIKQQTASIMVNKKEGTAGFGSAYMAAYYVTQFTDDGRHALSDAVNAYLQDFEEKKLDRSGKGSYKQYGKAGIRLDWGTIKSSTPNYGKGYAYLGYKFKNNSPYFTLTIYPVENGRKANDDLGDESSLMLDYYMTKAQATTLVSLLSDEIVEGALNAYSESLKSTLVDTSDDYDGAASGGDVY